MDRIEIIGVAFVGSLLVVGFVISWHWPPSRRRRLVHRYATKRALVLDAEAASLAERLLVAAQRGRYLAANLAVVVTYPIALTLPDDDASLAAVMAFLIVMSVGAQIAAAGGAAVAVHRAGGLSVDQRTARLHAPRLDDFLPPLLRWWSLGALAVAAAAVAAGLVVRPTEPILSGQGLVAAWVVCAVLVVAAEAVAHVLLRVPQPAASPLALAVRDEVKGDLLTVVVAGFLGPMLVTMAVVSDLVPEAVAPVIAAFLVPLVPLECQRRRRVRERLWAAEPAH